MTRLRTNTMDMTHPVPTPTTAQITASPRAWAELMLLALIWGGSFLCNAVVLREVGFATVVAFRVSGAALVLWAYVLLRGLRVPMDLRMWGAFAVMGLLNNALPFTLITFGQQHIPSGLSAILNSTTAVFGILIAAMVFADERLTARKLIGVSLGFCGAATAIGVKAIHAFDITSVAQLALIGAAICYGLSGAWARARLTNVSPQIATAGMLTCSSAMMIPYALWTEDLPSLTYSAATWGAIAYLAVLATAGAYLLYYRIAASAGVGNLLLVTLLVAPVAIALGALVLGESLAPNAYAGFALLAAGLVIIDGRIPRRLRAWRHKAVPK